MRSRIDALLSRHNTDLTFSIDMRSIDLYALRLTDKPFKAGMCLHMDGSTNLKKRSYGTRNGIGYLSHNAGFGIPSQRFIPERTGSSGHYVCRHFGR